MPNETKPLTRTVPPPENIEDVFDWWMGGRGLLSCMMELETYCRTKDRKNLENVKEELATEKEAIIISEDEHSALLEMIKDILEEDEEDTRIEMTAPLYALLEGHLSRVLYNNHPAMIAEEVHLQPGTWNIKTRNKNYFLDISEGNVILQKTHKIDLEGGDDEEEAEGETAGEAPGETDEATPEEKTEETSDDDS